MYPGYTTSYHTASCMVYRLSTSTYSVHLGFYFPPVFRLYTSSVASLYNSNCSVYWYSLPSCVQTLLIDSNCILALNTVLYPQCSHCLTDCLCSDSMLALTFTLCTQTIHWFILPCCTQTVYYTSTHSRPILKLYWHSLPSCTRAVY